MRCCLICCIVLVGLLLLPLSSMSITGIQTDAEGKSDSELQGLDSLLIEVPIRCLDALAGQQCALVRVPGRVPATSACTEIVRRNRSLLVFSIHKCIISQV